jgi:hypothetical protein
MEIFYFWNFDVNSSSLLPLLPLPAPDSRTSFVPTSAIYE